MRPDNYPQDRLPEALKNIDPPPMSDEVIAYIERGEMPNRARPAVHFDTVPVVLAGIDVIAHRLDRRSIANWDLVITGEEHKIANVAQLLQGARGFMAKFPPPFGEIPVCVTRWRMGDDEGTENTKALSISLTAPPAEKEPDPYKCVPITVGGIHVTTTVPDRGPKFAKPWTVVIAADGDTLKMVGSIFETGREFIVEFPHPIGKFSAIATEWTYNHRRAMVATLIRTNASYEDDVVPLHVIAGSFTARPADAKQVPKGHEDFIEALLGLAKSGTVSIPVVMVESSQGQEPSGAATINYAALYKSYLEAYVRTLRGEAIPLPEDIAGLMTVATAVRHAERKLDAEALDDFIAILKKKLNLS